MIFSASKIEREVDSLIQGHCDKVGECLSEFIQFAKNYLKLEKTLKDKVLTERKQYKDGSFNVHNLESEADELRRVIFVKLNAGAFLPNARQDYARIVKIVDKIANKAESSADYIMLEAPQVPAKYHHYFIEILDLIKKSFTHIDSIVDLFYTNQDKIEAEVDIVRALERECDGLEWNAQKDIFLDDNLELAQKMHLRDFVHHLGAICNLIEDAADFIHIIVIHRRL